MKNVKIRELKLSDMPKIKELLETREGFGTEKAEKRTQLLQWLAFNNPFANGGATYYVAEDEERIIAHLGRMPIELAFQGERHRSYFMHDLYVHPEYRQKGQGFFLSMALYDTVEEQSDTFFCGLWATPLNLKLLQLRKYDQLRANKYVKILDPRKLRDPRRNLKFKGRFLLPLLNPIIRFFMGCVDFVLLGIYRGDVIIIELQRFDERIDKLNKRILSKFRVSVCKDSNYLNWKYIDRPFGKKMVFAAERNGDLTGYLVLNPKLEGEFYRGTILDIMADPDDKKTISALCCQAIKYFRKKGAYSINVFLTDSRLASVFKTFLFLKDPARDSFFLGNLSKCNTLRDDLLEISNWHLSYGDSDGAMLRP